MPLSDAVGNEGTLTPAQIVKDVPNANVGVMFGLTVTVNVVPFAHWLPPGVKV